MTRAEGVGEPVEEEVGVTGENRLGGGGMECLVRSVSVTLEGGGETEGFKRVMPWSGLSWSGTRV